jgi:aspartate carbamoyltransferase catalytic subunit
MKHLLSISDLGPEGIEEVLHLTDKFVEVSGRAIPKVPALRGKTVVSLFYEESTRTRLSFETAAKRLSADVMTFTVGNSSVAKGESFRDTVETISAMGIDAVVVRHRSAGAPARVAQWIDASVVNAGDGCHEHPTQALLDCYTVRSRFGSLEGRRIAIVGDIDHSRVARSAVLAFTALGAEVILVAPPTLLPASMEGWPVTVAHDLDEILPTLDVIYLLRLQRERMTEALVPSLREYRMRWGLTGSRLHALPETALVMHPGPINRGVEIDDEAAQDARSVINAQVANGVAVRMAVLYLLLGSATVQPTATVEPAGAIEPAIRVGSPTGSRPVSAARLFAAADLVATVDPSLSVDSPTRDDGDVSPLEPESVVAAQVDGDGGHPAGLVVPRKDGDAGPREPRPRPEKNRAGVVAHG